MIPSIRPARPGDLEELTDIYNYYVLNTPITFDLDAYTAHTRHAWFDQNGSIGLPSTSHGGRTFLRVRPLQPYALKSRPRCVGIESVVRVNLDADPIG